MRPATLRTKIFLDGGDPEGTRRAIAALGFLDGQTTNPSLIAGSPGAKARLASGRKFSRQEVKDYYHGVATEISSLIPQGSVSLEVYADASVPAGAMLEEARQLNTWIPNAHIKFPTTAAGLEAARQAVAQGLGVNMTLVFSQAQAAAVYAVTLGAAPGKVFVSPFVGRLDDRGENGMDLIANILRMYAPGDGHSQVLTASVRSMGHFLYALALGSDIITAPLALLLEWAGQGLPVPGPDHVYNAGTLAPIPYRDIALGADVKAYDIAHELTDKGMARFASDWNALIEG